MANTTKIIRDLRNVFDKYQYGVQAGVGAIWYVDSVNGAASNSGTEKDRALITIDAAINLASADDTIIVLPGHVETVALATDLVPDKSVSIIGIGTGTRRPTITMSAVASKIIFSADDILMRNFIFLMEADVTIGIEFTTSKGSWVDRCDFRARIPATAKQWVNCIDIGGATAEDSAFARVSNCWFNCPAAGAASCILISTITTGIEIDHNYMFGDFDDACIQSAVAHLACRIHHNQMLNDQTGDHVIQFSAAATGHIHHNMGATDIAAGVNSIDPGACMCNQNYSTDEFAKSGALDPAIAA